MDDGFFVSPRRAFTSSLPDMTKKAHHRMVGNWVWAGPSARRVKVPLLGLLS